MDEQQQSRRWLTRKRALWTAGIVIVIVGVCIFLRFAYVGEWKWTGLIKNPDYHKRTLWDWLDLLIVPTILAAGGVWFNWQQRKRELEIAERRAQDEALQAYLDQMAQLLTDKAQPLDCAHPGGPLSTVAVAQARTRTALSRLDGSRKRNVLDFLYEANLIRVDNSVIELGSHDYEFSAADLSEADLKGAFLRNADLSGPKTGANLTGADLRGADLIGANLSCATLKGANLAGVILSDVADKSRVPTNLQGADLSGVRGVTNAELEQQTEALEGATMPNGQRYKDWLKDKAGKGEQLTTSQKVQLNIFTHRGSSATSARANYAEGKLDSADFTNASLEGAIFIDATLEGADFSNATLNGADFTDAKGITADQLENQAKSLEGATMPNGQKYEDWLKSKGSEEGKNRGSQ